MFVNLHSHSLFSDLDGIAKLDEMAAKAAADGATAFTVTDHGRVNSWFEAMKAAKKHGIKFIPAIEAYVSLPEDDEKANSSKAKYYHLTILAKNEEGVKEIFGFFKNGITQSKRNIFLHDQVYTPSKNLIILSGCVGGELASYTVGIDGVKEPNLDKARDYIEKAKELWPHFYLEISDHGDGLEKAHSIALIELSEELDVPVVATSDSHYTEKSDHEIHQLYMASSKYGEWGVSQGDYSYMTRADAIKSFTDLGYYKDTWVKAIDESGKVAELADDDIKLPMATPDEFHDIRPLVMERWEEYRKGTDREEESLARVEKELGVIEMKNYTRYFFTVHTFVNWFKSLGGIIGPGRGSGAGSEVAYLLGITEVDPLKYDLLFERFLNPGRDSPPDFDIDFQGYITMEDGRVLAVKDAISEWAITSGFFEHVAKISTYSTLGISQALKDLMRASGVPFKEANKITTSLMAEQLVKLSQSQKNLGVALEDIGVEETPEIHMSFASAPRILGSVKQPGIHASGVILSNSPIPEDSDGMSLFDYPALEAMGFIKYDILVVDALSHIKDTIDSMPENRKQRYLKDGQINWDGDDPAVFAYLLNGGDRNIFTFQFGSNFVSNLTRQVRPTTIEDIALINAMNRPGPQEMKLPELYVKLRNGEEVELSPGEEAIAEALGDGAEHGVLIYQEQAMKLAQVMSDFTLAEADDLRSAIGKKKGIDKVKAKFVSQFKGDKHLAEDVWDYIEPFGGYAFNKSHSIAYSMIGYVTAQLMTYDPGYYLATIRRNGSGKSNQVVKYAKLANIDVRAAQHPAKLSTYFDGEVLWLSPVEHDAEWLNIQEFYADKGIPPRTRTLVVDFGYWGRNVESLKNISKGNVVFNLFTQPAKATPQDLETIRRTQVRTIGMSLDLPRDGYFTKWLKDTDSIKSKWAEVTAGMSAQMKKSAWNKFPVTSREWKGKALLVVCELNKYKNYIVSYQVGDEQVSFMIQKWNTERWDFYSEATLGDFHQLHLDIRYNPYSQTIENQIKEVK